LLINIDAKPSNIKGRTQSLIILKEEHRLM
jgi:hypothetical protein